MLNINIHCNIDVVIQMIHNICCNKHDSTCGIFCLKSMSLYQIVPLLSLGNCDIKGDIYKTFTRHFQLKGSPFIR